LKSIVCGIVSGIIGGIIGGVIVFGMIILMPNEIPNEIIPNEIEQYIEAENSGLQICHKVIGEMLELSEKYKVASTPELKEKYVEFMFKYAECEKDFPEWRNTFPMGKYGLGT